MAWHSRRQLDFLYSLNIFMVYLHHIITVSCVPHCHGCWLLAAHISVSVSSLSRHLRRAGSILFTLALASVTVAATLSVT